MSRMRVFYFIFFSVYIWSAYTGIAHAAVTLKEVVFDPQGTDTGAEYIVVENSMSASVDMTGWTLYPDGAGYYTFPSFVLQSGAAVTVHLRMSGVSDSQNLYHSGASQNMGNTSGSVALFSSSQRSADTMIDFVEYGRAGETWESDAEKATLWTKGQFVAFGADTAEGKVLRRVASGHAPDAWRFEVVSSTQSVSANNSTASSNVAGSQSSQTPSTTSSGSVYSGPTKKVVFVADAGKDQEGVAGGDVFFEGRLFDSGAKLVESEHIRFLWNFGDGTSLEGKNVRHAYRYPGHYTAIVIAAFGEDSFRDEAMITIVPNMVGISEVMPGDQGWIELSNPSNTTVDISGWIMRDARNTMFQFPAKTVLSQHAYVVFASPVTHLSISNQNPIVVLEYPDYTPAEKFAWTGMVPDGKSISSVHDVLSVTTPSPGTSNTTIVAQQQGMQADEEGRAMVSQKKEKIPYTKAFASVKVPQENNSVSKSSGSTQGAFGSREYMWLLASASAGVFLGFVAIRLRAFFASR